MLPGYRDNLVLTSGAPMPWSEYMGGQRDALIGGALFEGLADNREEAIAGFARGEIEIGGCHDYAAVGITGRHLHRVHARVRGREPHHGNLGFCNFYEGKEPRRLNYGCYDEGVRERLLHVNTVLAPVVGEALRRWAGLRSSR